MQVIIVPIWLYLAPFMLLIALIGFLNWIVKHGNALRVLTLILSLVLGGIWIFLGYFLFGYVIFFSLVVMFTGVLFLIIGVVRSLAVSKQQITNDEILGKKYEEVRKNEEKNWESYDWLCAESQKILNSGRIDDYAKFSRLIGYLDNNKRYDEFARLSKELKALDEKKREEISQKMNGGRSL